MIGLEKYCRVFGTTAKNLMWSLLETMREGGHHSLLTFKALCSSQTSLQASHMLVPVGDFRIWNRAYSHSPHLVWGSISVVWYPWLVGPALCRPSGEGARTENQRDLKFVQQAYFVLYVENVFVLMPVI